MIVSISARCAGMSSLGELTYATVFGVTLFRFSAGRTTSWVSAWSVAASTSLTALRVVALVSAATALAASALSFCAFWLQAASEIAAAAVAVHDPLWRLPLWPGYRGMLDSKIADTNNVSSGGFAGSITAALFLQKFVENARAWAHFDIYAWNPTARPGRPEGGEAQAIRALFRVIERRFPRG